MDHLSRSQSARGALFRITSLVISSLLLLPSLVQGTQRSRLRAHEGKQLQLQLQHGNGILNDADDTVNDATSQNYEGCFSVTVGPIAGTPLSVNVGFRGGFAIEQGDHSTQYNKCIVFGEVNVRGGLTLTIAAAYINLNGRIDLTVITPPEVSDLPQAVIYGMKDLFTSALEKFKKAASRFFGPQRKWVQFHNKLKREDTEMMENVRGIMKGMVTRKEMEIKILKAGLDLTVKFADYLEEILWLRLPNLEQKGTKKKVYAHIENAQQTCNMMMKPKALPTSVKFTVYQSGTLAPRPVDNSDPPTKKLGSHISSFTYAVEFEHGEPKPGLFYKDFRELRNWAKENGCGTSNGALPLSDYCKTTEPFPEGYHKGLKLTQNKANQEHSRDFVEKKQPEIEGWFVRTLHRCRTQERVCTTKMREVLYSFFEPTQGGKFKAQMENGLKGAKEVINEIPDTMEHLLDNIIVDAFKHVFLPGAVFDDKGAVQHCKGITPAVTTQGLAGIAEHQARKRLCQLAKFGGPGYKKKKQPVLQFVKQLFVFPHEYTDETHMKLRDETFDDMVSASLWNPARPREEPDKMVERLKTQTQLVTPMEKSVFMRKWEEHTSDAECKIEVTKLFDETNKKLEAFLAHMRTHAESYLNFHRLKDTEYTKGEWRCSLNNEEYKKAVKSCFEVPDRDLPSPGLYETESVEEHPATVAEEDSSDNGSSVDDNESNTMPLEDCVKRSIREAKIEKCSVCVPPKDATSTSEVDATNYATNFGQRTRGKPCPEGWQKAPVSRSNFKEAWERVVRAFEDDATFDEVKADIAFDTSTSMDQESSIAQVFGSKDFANPDNADTCESIDHARLRRVNHVLTNPDINWVLREQNEQGESQSLHFVQWMHLLSLESDEFQKNLVPDVSNHESATTDNCGNAECGCGLQEIQLQGSFGVGVTVTPGADEGSMGFCTDKPWDLAAGVAGKMTKTKRKGANGVCEFSKFEKGPPVWSLRVKARPPVEIFKLGKSSDWTFNFGVAASVDGLEASIAVGFPDSLVNMIFPAFKSGPGVQVNLMKVAYMTWINVALREFGLCKEKLACDRNPHDSNKENEMIGWEGKGMCTVKCLLSVPVRFFKAVIREIRTGINYVTDIASELKEWAMKFPDPSMIIGDKTAAETESLTSLLAISETSTGVEDLPSTVSEKTSSGNGKALDPDSAEAMYERLSGESDSKPTYDEVLKKKMEEICGKQPPERWNKNNFLDASSSSSIKTFLNAEWQALKDEILYVLTSNIGSLEQTHEMSIKLTHKWHKQMQSRDQNNAIKEARTKVAFLISDLKKIQASGMGIDGSFVSRIPTAAFYETAI